MKKIVLIMAMAALVCWLPGQVLASADFTSHLTVLGTTVGSNFPTLTDYGTVVVHWNGLSSATVTITPYENVTTNHNDFDFVQQGFSPYTYSAFLNVAGTVQSYTVSTGQGWTADGTLQTADGLGTFDVAARTSSFNAEDITFTLTAASGTTWADAASVLAGNSLGFDAAVYLDDVSQWFGSDYSGFVGEKAAVPVPPSALLLGSGLLGLVGFGWRRKKS